MILDIFVLSFLFSLYIAVYIHCNLVIMLRIGAKQKERCNEMSVIMK